MLNRIRNISTGWIVVVLGCILFITGLSIGDTIGLSGSMVCFDYGCYKIQTYSSILLGVCTVVMGGYLVKMKQY